MEISLVKIIITIINFIILVLILKHFLWAKIEMVISLRQQEINESITKAENFVKESENLKIENEKVLGMTKVQSRKITKEKKLQADKMYDEIVEAAKFEADVIKLNAQNEIEMEFEKAKFEIKKQVVDLSLSVSKKVLEKEIDEKTHNDLINNFIDEVI